MAWERVFEGDERVICVMNAGKKFWTASNYGAWVGGGKFKEVFCSSAPQYGGNDTVVSNGTETKNSHDGARPPL